MSDYGTKELHERNKGNVEILKGRQTTSTARITVQRKLDELNKRGVIDEDQYSAGERFFELWFLFGAMKHNHTISQYGQRIETPELTEEQYERGYRRWIEAKKSISRLPVAIVTYNVCCLDQWPAYWADVKRHTILLREGLDDLVKYFFRPQK